MNAPDHSPPVLHQFEVSPFCDKIRRILAYKSIAFIVRDYPTSAGGEIRKINALGKLPVLEHEGHFIADSTDIAYYLDQRFPALPVIPSDPRENALVHVLEDWADESLYFYEMSLRFFRSGSARANIEQILVPDKGLKGWLLRRLIPSPIGMPKILHMQGTGRKTMAQLLVDVRRHVGAVSAMLDGRDWLVGNSPTLADFAVSSMFACFLDAPEVHEIFEHHPGVKAWMQRLQQPVRQAAENQRLARGIR